MDILTPDARTPGASAGAAAPPPRDDAPQLRTLLLTDLCDSTMLVERLGDTPAAALFRAHDALVLRLQQQWRGRLIDRSDGLLLLFERPIDGLGFALDYARGLRDIGAERGHALQARAGLHVGEVLTWRNSAEAVSVGAKPLEVEGLAKPMAGRLMAMARPGQILLSAVAEPLTHRAAREFGQRGETLLWKSHGRWRFKGVPQAQEIFEVGEPGLAPLRAPAASPKAWRDIPMWRRPAALAAQAAVLGAVVVGTWFALRPQPAIAFGERDWVVVGDLRNLTGQPVLDESLEQAFRISLEQSRYVNVLSDLKARDTLARMRRPADTKLDRAIASEIALRDGARAVILPTVSEVGGRVRVSVELIDPGTQSTTFTASADGRGASSLLASVDSVNAELRAELGEQLRDIKSSSLPLPQVATDNLEALRAYAVGQQAYATGDTMRALDLFKLATQLDADFALAWIGQARALLSDGRGTSGAAAVERAYALASKLPRREGLYVDAWWAEYRQPALAAAKWNALAETFPDYVPAQANSVIWLLRENRYREAAPLVQRQLDAKNPMRALAYDSLSQVRLGMGDSAGALVAAKQAIDLGRPTSRRRAAQALASADRLSDARDMLNVPVKTNRYLGFERIAIAIEQRRLTEARAEIQDVLAVGGVDDGFTRQVMALADATVAILQGDVETARRSVAGVEASALDHLQSTDPADAVDYAQLACTARRIGAHAGAAGGDGVARMLERRKDLAGMLIVAEVCAAADAAVARMSDQPKAAIKQLSPFLTGRERFGTRVELMLAAKAAGDRSAERAHRDWLASHRNLAYAQIGCGQCQQTFDVAQLAELTAVRSRARLKSG